MQEMRRRHVAAGQGKVDVHTHILPARLPDFAKKFGGGGFPTLARQGKRRGCLLVDGRRFRDLDDRCWDPARRLEDCDRDGVSLQALSTVPVMFCYWAKPRQALDVARFLNDDIAGVVRDRSGRFAGLATLPLQAPDMACRELERCQTYRNVRSCRWVRDIG